MSIFLLCIFIYIIKVNICPINVSTTNILCLPVYIAFIHALNLLSLTNNRKNRTYIKDLCCDHNHFNSKFCTYSKQTYNNIMDIDTLSITIYEYVLFTNKFEEVNKNE